MGYTIKLLGIANKIDSDIDIRVHPTMIHNDHPLASVRNENNAVFFNGDMTGPVIMYGKGAGSLPTASAVVSDIIQIARGDMDNISPITIDEKANLLDVNQRSARYYLRIHTKNTPGILAAIAGKLGDHGISISGVMQKEIDEDVIPLIILTHEAIEGKMLKAIEKIQEYDFIDEDVMLIRIEDSRTGEKYE
jgi:homoserine dehydrogenase